MSYILPGKSSFLIALAYGKISQEGIDRLIRLERKWRGKNPRWDGVSKRWQFARYLYLTGKIGG
jgi:hypothetical protein